jgi:hypothetical protein
LPRGARRNFQRPLRVAASHPSAADNADYVNWPYARQPPPLHVLPVQPVGCPVGAAAAAATVDRE